MTLAAREPQPSLPIQNIASSIKILSESSAFINSWKWIFAEEILQIQLSGRLTSLEFFQPDETIVDMSVDLFHFHVKQITASIALIFDIAHNYTEQLLEKQPVTVDAGDTSSRLANIERDFAISSTSPEFYKEFSYSGEDLIGYNIFTDSGKLTQLYAVGLNFSGDILTSKVITRISDGSVLTVTFGYTGELLTSQTRSIA